MCNHCGPIELPDIGPGQCLRCGQGERAGYYHATLTRESVVYSHVCRECQDECRAYYPCLICEAEIEIEHGEFGREASELHICQDCHTRIRQLLADGFTPYQIAGRPSSWSRIKQICEAVEIGRENWIRTEV